MTRKIGTIALILLLGIVCANAQQHEFSVYGGGGFSALSYKMDGGAQKGGFGGQFGLNYRYAITRDIGVMSGIGFGMYNARYSADDVESVRKVHDRLESVDFDFTSTLNGYEEKQGATLLQIPVLAQYLRRFGNLQCYANGGLKFGIPLGGQFSNTAERMKNTGYYSLEEYTYETQTFMGFGTFTDRGNRGDLDFKVAVLATLEAGTKFYLNDEMALYVGAFFDFGLNNIHKAKAPYFVEYNEQTPQNFEVNSVIHSRYEHFTDKIRPIAVGIKVALALEK